MITKVDNFYYVVSKLCDMKDSSKIKKGKKSRKKVDARCQGLMSNIVKISFYKSNSNILS